MVRSQNACRFLSDPKTEFIKFIIVTSHTSSEAFKSTYSNGYEVDQLLESFNLYPKIQQALKVSRNLYKWKIETLPNTYQFSSKDFASHRRCSSSNSSFHGTRSISRNRGCVSTSFKFRKRSRGF